MQKKFLLQFIGTLRGETLNYKIAQNGCYR